MQNAADKKEVPAGSDENPENQVQKLKYPRGIPFIILNELCERFNYYGLRAILVLYVTRKLMYEEDEATLLYHLYSMLVYGFCIFGAVIADSWLGKFKTILILSIVYSIGSSVVTVGAIEAWNLPAGWFTLIGLCLIAIGSGGIKPCVSAFGAEQFQLPEQAKQMASFFSIFYFVINLGSLISTLVTPVLREDVTCFGVDDCFPLAFGIPALLMLIAVVIFVGGKFLYKIVPCQGNMLLKVCRCIWAAITIWKRDRKTNPKEHWLEHAQESQGKKLVMETKILLHVLLLFLPLPLFWALFDQQGSRWTIQATKMNLDNEYFSIKPDQMQVVNPLLILTFIPLCEYVIYPLLNCIGVRRPLQKMAIGGLLAGAAFVCSAVVQLLIDISDPYTVNVVWQIPQYAIMTLGEVMFSVTGLQFSFTQAPESMKSVLQACWLMTVACGNLIVLFVVGVGFMPYQAVEFMLFAVLMFIDMVVFMLLAFFYKPIPLSEIAKIED